MKKYGPNAKYPRIVDEFIASGEPLRTLECPDAEFAKYVCSKVLRNRYHVELRGLVAVRRKSTVYLVNPFASCVKKVEV